MFSDDSWSEAIAKSIFWIIGILFTCGMLYCFEQLSEEEKRDIIIIIMMGNSQ